MQGCTIYKQDESVFIGKQSKGGDAEISGKLHLYTCTCKSWYSIVLCLMNFADLLREGDELLEINGVPVTGKSADEIVALMVHMHVCVMSCSTCMWSSITAWKKSCIQIGMGRG